MDIAMVLILVILIGMGILAIMGAMILLMIGTAMSLMRKVFLDPCLKILKELHLRIKEKRIPCRR
jgi:hypothetical protein